MSNVLTPPKAEEAKEAFGPGQATADGNGTANGNGYAHEQDKTLANGNDHHYQGTGYQGANLSHAITPGGHTAQDSLYGIPSAHRKYANPLPLGVFAFSVTTLLLNLYFLNAHGVELPNAILCYALGLGGFTQLIAGMLEFSTGNTFGATVFTTYGLFWWGYSMSLVPFFGLSASWDGLPGAYAMGSPGAVDEANATGLFLITWFCIDTIFLIASIRSSVSIFLLLLALDITFVLLAAAQWSGNPHVLTAGGSFGVITGALGFYIATASLLTPDTSYFTLPLGSLAKDTSEDDAALSATPSNEYRRPNLKQQLGLAPDPNAPSYIKPTSKTPALHRTITPGGHPQDSSQPGFPVFHRKTGNPVPLGAIGIGSTFFLLGLALVKARGINEIAIWYAIGMPLGGIGVLLAGIWAHVEGNTFATTLFGGIGGVIFGFSLNELPWTNIRQAYAGSENVRTDPAFQNAIGILLLVTFIFIFCLTVASLRTSIPIAFALLLLQLALILYGVGQLLQKENVIKAGGGVFIAVGAVMWYVAGSALLNDEGVHALPVFPLPRHD